MKNTSLRFKLFTLSAFLLAVALIVGGVGYWSSSNIVKNFSKVTDWNLPNTRYVYDMIMHSRQARIYAFQLAMPGLDSARGDKLVEEVEELFKKFDNSRSIYLKEEFGPGEEDIWKRIDKPLQDIKNSTLKVVDLYKKKPSADSPEMKEMVRLITHEIDQANEIVKPSVVELINYHLNDSMKSTELAKEAANKGTLYTILAILIGSIAGSLFAISFSNNLVNTLSAISRSLSDASANVGSGSTQIASASQELSQATTEQAASLQQTASSIEEMNSMISRNTDNAKKSSEYSLISQSNAQKGKATVEQMILSIDEINNANTKIKEQVDHSNAQMQEIVKVIGEIGNKTKVINDIVFQTKLLSFNASVEAARAGDHGKGFAVVAEEVGNLASMSGSAAQEISQMLDDSIKKVEGIVNDTKLNVGRLVDESKVKVESGTKIAHDCGQVLEEIVSSISNVASMTQEISVASTEQAQGMTEITRAMNSLDQVTQQNSAVSEQAASAAEELSGQAMSLNDLVATLVRTVNGGDVPLKHQNVMARPAPVRKENVVALQPKKKVATNDAPAPKMKATADQPPVYDDSRFSDV